MILKRIRRRWLGVLAATVTIVVVAIWLIRREAAHDASTPESHDDPVASGSGLDDAIQSLDRTLAALEKSLATLDDGPSPPFDENQPSDLPSSVEDLMRRYEELGSSPERVRVMREFAVQFPLYARDAADEHLAYLPFLRSVAQSSSKDEREHAIIAVHGLADDAIVQFLIDHLSSPHAELRFYSAEGLAWSARAGHSGASRALVGALSHDDAKVRGIAAVCIGTVVGDKRLVDSLLNRLREEQVPRVVQSLVMSIIRLNAEEGRRRVEELALSVSPETQRAIEDALRDV